MIDQKSNDQLSKSFIEFSTSAGKRERERERERGREREREVI